ncbi:MAG: hypothetical protein HUK25_09820, partial [Treponema sp.]|nr:hypothetical protein [Treponema sp.]
IYKDVDSEVKKWQGTPEKLKNSVDSVTASVQTVMNTDWSKVTDPKKIEEAISTITKTTTEAQNLSKTVAETAEDLKADVNKVQSYAVQIEQAVKSDSVLVQNKVNEMKTLFSADGIKDVMNDGVQSMLYEYTGKYYPYVSKAMDMAVSSIGNKETTPEDEAKKQAKKEKKEADKAKKKAREERLKRSEGVDIYYKADRVPKLLIENVVASGYEYGTENLLFKGTAENITSDQNMIGKNTKIAADFKILEHPNNAKVIIDARANSNDPLVTASYNGGGYDINADAKVFNLKSKSDITAILTADENGSFSVGGILDMNVSEMTGMDFEPEMVNRIYKNSLAGIKKLTLGFEIGYKAETESFYVEIKNMDELGRQLVTPVVKAMTSELSVIADDAMNKALAMLTENTGIATDSISEFVKISDLINGEKSSLDNLTKQLEAKKKELTDQLSNKATSAAKDALKNAGVDTEKMGGASKMLKGLKF